MTGLLLYILVTVITTAVRGQVVLEASDGVVFVPYTASVSSACSTLTALIGTLTAYIPVPCSDMNRATWSEELVIGSTVAEVVVAPSGNVQIIPEPWLDVGTTTTSKPSQPSISGSTLSPSSSRSNSISTASSHTTASSKAGLNDPPENNGPTTTSTATSTARSWTGSNTLLGNSASNSGPTVDVTTASIVQSTAATATSVSMTVSVGGVKVGTSTETGTSSSQTSTGGPNEGLSTGKSSSSMDTSAFFVDNASTSGSPLTTGRVIQSSNALTSGLASLGGSQRSTASITTMRGTATSTAFTPPLSSDLTAFAPSGPSLITLSMSGQSIVLSRYTLSGYATLTGVTTVTTSLATTNTAGIIGYVSGPEIIGPGGVVFGLTFGGQGGCGGFTIWPFCSGGSGGSNGGSGWCIWPFCGGTGGTVGGIDGSAPKGGGGDGGDDGGGDGDDGHTQEQQSQQSTHQASTEPAPLSSAQSSASSTQFTSSMTSTAPACALFSIPADSLNDDGPTWNPNAPEYQGAIIPTAYTIWLEAIAGSFPTPTPTTRAAYPSTSFLTSQAPTLDSSSTAPVGLLSTSSSFIPLDVGTSKSSPTQPTSSQPSSAVIASAAQNLATTTKAVQPSTTVAAEPNVQTAVGPPTATETSYNHEGSSLCSTIGEKACVAAYTQYNDTHLYTAYTSYVAPSGMDSIINYIFAPFADDGCAAMFTCNSEADYAVGMLGSQINAAFVDLFDHSDVGTCGSSYLSNGCHVTVNGCDDCNPDVPCGALDAADVAANYPCYGPADPACELRTIWSSRGILLSRSCVCTDGTNPPPVAVNGEYQCSLE